MERHYINHSFYLAVETISYSVNKGYRKYESLGKIDFTAAIDILYYYMEE
jgi:hypothetical protein